MRIHSKHRSTIRNFLVYFVPFIFTSVILGIFTLFLSGFYLLQHFFSYNIDNLMDILEISNRDQICPILSRVDFSTRVLPSFIIFCGASLGVMFLVFYLTAIIMFPSEAWKVCESRLYVQPTSDPNQTQPTIHITQPSNESQERQPPTNPNYPVLPEKVDRY